MFAPNPLSSSMLAKTMHDYSLEKAQARLATADIDNPTPKEKGRFRLKNLFGKRPLSARANKEMFMAPTD